MKKRHSIIWTLCLIPFVGLARAAATEPDALPGSAHDLEEVVVTGTRSETDIRHLPMTVSVVDRRRIEQSNMPSLLPILSERFRGCSPPDAASWVTAFRAERPARCRCAA